MFKRIMLILNIILLLVPTIVLAETDSYNKIAAVSNAFLNVLKWIGYALALGILIIYGIKFLLSTANDKADLKKKAFPFIAGVIIISLCTTIAKTVANIGYKEEDGDAPTSFIDKTIELSGITISDKAAMQQTTAVKVNEENGITTSTEYTYADGSYMVETYHDANGKLVATQTYYDGEGTAAENRTKTITYDNDGKMISEKKYLEDGTYEETKYVQKLTNENQYIANNILGSNNIIKDKDGKIVENIDFNDVFNYKYQITYRDTQNNVVAEGEAEYRPDLQKWVIEKNTFQERK